MINTIKHLCYILRSRESELDQIIENIDHYYNHQIQPKKKYGDLQIQNGKVRNRDLFASQNRLKEIQQNLNAFLQTNITLPTYAYGSVKGRNHVMNADAHYGSTYFYSVDLKNFFTNIFKNIVFVTFRHYNFSPCVSRKLTQLTTYKNKLQQGPPSSPFIANLVFSKMGDELLKKAEANQIIFTSYLDDLTFSSKNNFKGLLPEILRVIIENGFILNHKKISYRKTKAEITGLVVSPKGITVPNIVRQRANTIPRVKQYSIWVENFFDTLRR